LITGFIAVVASAGGLAQSDALDCLITPSETVDISSETMGLINLINVDRGDYVSAGEVIAELASGVEQANLVLARERAADQSEIDQAQARLRFLKGQESRASELFAQSLESRETLDQAEMERILAEHAVTRAQVNQRLAQLEMQRSEEILKQKTIISPIDGVVMHRDMRVGEFVNETSSIMRLAQIDPLYVEIFVPLDFYNQVAEGDIATVRLRPPLSGDYQAIVGVVDYVMDAASGTFGVRLILENPDREIPAGVRCEAVL